MLKSIYTARPSLIFINVGALSSPAGTNPQTLPLYLRAGAGMAVTRVRSLRRSFLLQAGNLSFHPFIAMQRAACQMLHAESHIACFALHTQV
jgi:hypothetical protein